MPNKLSKLDWEGYFIELLPVNSFKNFSKTLTLEALYQEFKKREKLEKEDEAAKTLKRRSRHNKNVRVFGRKV